MSVDIGVLVGILGTVCSVVFAYIAFGRSRKKDDAAYGQKDGIVLTEIGYIKSGVDDIKRKQEHQEDQHIEVISRLTGVEASAKQAHKRIDAIQKG